MHRDSEADLATLQEFCILKKRIDDSAVQSSTNTLQEHEGAQPLARPSVVSSFKPQKLRLTPRLKAFIPESCCPHASVAQHKACNQQVLLLHTGLPGAGASMNKDQDTPGFKACGN